PVALCALARERGFEPVELVADACGIATSDRRDQLQIVECKEVADAPAHLIEMSRQSRQKPGPRQTALARSRNGHAASGRSASTIDVWSRWRKLSAVSRSESVTSSCRSRSA